ncbi:MAG: hypothetical protein Kow0029_25900 [Candidatus Rifleibacteriota bacterium]
MWALEAASELQAGIVVVHPGYGPWILGHKFDEWLARAEKYLIMLVEHAASLDLKIAFENIYDSGPFDLAKLLSVINHQNAGICLDIGHFNVFCRNHKLSEWCELLGKKIFELHLHDNDGTADQHIAPGDGKIDYLPLIEWYKSLTADSRPILTLELPHRTHVIKAARILKEWFF